MISELRKASLLALAVFFAPWCAPGQEKTAEMELSRAVRPAEFLCAVGQKAGIFGNESGNVEAWVYPLKLFREFTVKFREGDREWEGSALVRRVVAQPESTTLVYVGDTFRVEETFFVPVDQPGAAIRFEIETERPLEITASFVPDFQLEWPAAMGGTYTNWDAGLRAFTFGEEQKMFAGIVGSPTGVMTEQAFATNYGVSNVESLRLGMTANGKDTKLIVIAGSVHGSGEAEATYKNLAANAVKLESESAAYYAKYLRETVQLELPDAELQESYDWSRISTLQGVVSNPYLGKGLVAGYRTSGASQRPGFAWFFGRDSLWTSFALDSEGDYATTRDALRFLIPFQRADGKIPHEISQTASLVDWFKGFPYGFASADATPLFVIATEEYVRSSGDTQFAKENWDAIEKAYRFLGSTYDDAGLPRNLNVGHGWVEGGPLLPVRTELYQAGLGLEAQAAFAELAKVAGKSVDGLPSSADLAKQKAKVDADFWSAENKAYAFAIDANGKRVDEASVLATVPMWFGLLDEKHSEAMIEQLASHDHAADWGMRIISSRSAVYSGGGYHYGAVWPLFTGWAAVAEYRYHQAQPAMQALRANALLALDGSPGHVTEVLSGDYYQGLSTSSPHQIWSAAMVVSPMLRGLLGLRTDALTHSITLAPHLPADWDRFAARGLSAGGAKLDVAFHRSTDEMTLELKREGGAELQFNFEPALSPRAQVASAELNGKPVAFRVEAHGTDQHLILRTSIPAGTSRLRVKLRNDFGIAYVTGLPAPGEKSNGLRILSESWSTQGDAESLELEGTPGATYVLSYFRGADLERVEGGGQETGEAGAGQIRVTIPQGTTKEENARTELVLHFGKRTMKK